MRQIRTIQALSRLVIAFVTLPGTALMAAQFDVRLRSNFGPEVRGVVETATDTFAISSWSDPAGYGWTPQASQFPLVLHAFTDTGTAYEVADDWNGQLSGWAFLLPIGQDVRTILWNEGTPDPFWGGSSFGWGGLRNIAGGIALGGTNAFRYVPSDASRLVDFTLNEVSVTAILQPVIAFTQFNEPAIGTTTYAPGATGDELGFRTVSSPTGGVNPLVGVAIAGEGSTERVLTHRSINATTTFDAVDLSNYDDIIVSMRMQVANTTYEVGDMVRVYVTNGTDTINLVNLTATAATDAIDDLAGDGFLAHSAVIPDSWTQATLVITSSTNSTQGAERFDFDSIEFRGVAVIPEPGTWGFALAVLIAAGTIRWRRGARTRIRMADLRLRNERPGGLAHAGHTSILLLVALFRSSASAREYAFERVLDANDGINISNGQEVSINDAGTLLFRGEASGQNRDHLFLLRDGALTDLIGATQFQYFFALGSQRLNNRDEVVFRGRLQDGSDPAIFLWSDGVLRPVYRPDNVIQSVEDINPAINDEGQITFVAPIRQGPQSLILGDRNGSSPIVLDTGATVRPAPSPNITNGGAVVFNGFTSDGAVPGVFVREPSGVTRTLVTCNPCAFYEANNLGEVAYGEGNFDGSRRLWRTDGTSTTLIGTETGPLQGLGSPGINDRGDVVYGAGYDPAGSFVSIFVGPDPVADRVIGYGDPLFGGRLMGVYAGPSTINNHGQIALWTAVSDWANDQVVNYGIVVATPIPDRAVIAQTEFSEPNVGTGDYIPGATGREMGFRTVATGTGLNPSASVVMDGSERLLIHRSTNATTTFEMIELTGWDHVEISLMMRVHPTTYETGDELRVFLTDGARTLELFDEAATSTTDGLDRLGDDGLLKYALDIPESWSRAQLVIMSRSNSTQGAERFDFDSIEFRGVAVIPEPGTLWLAATVVLVALAAMRCNRTKPE